VVEQGETWDIPAAEENEHEAIAPRVKGLGNGGKALGCLGKAYFFRREKGKRERSWNSTSPTRYRGRETTTPRRYELGTSNLRAREGECGDGRPYKPCPFIKKGRTGSDRNRVQKISLRGDKSGLAQTVLYHENQIKRRTADRVGGFGRPENEKGPTTS